MSRALAALWVGADPYYSVGGCPCHVITVVLCLDHLGSTGNFQSSAHNSTMNDNNSKGKHY